VRSTTTARCGWCSSRSASFGRGSRGAEALARFQISPDRGPERWFAEAGEVGLRGELELTALRHALEKLSDLPNRIFLSVNISPTTLRSVAFLKVIRGADPRRIVVEVTEHTAVDDYDALNSAVARVRALGVRLAIDDAGAGFASLRTSCTSCSSRRTT
jgi:EAL domain-containing protein (putative c-di-GMP-specific phosphodiesterase class I)